MIYSAKFSGWDLLTISDLIVTYRKAKAYLFFETPSQRRFNLLLGSGFKME